MSRGERQTLGLLMSKRSRNGKSQEDKEIIQDFGKRPKAVDFPGDGDCTFLPSSTSRGWLNLRREQLWCTQGGWIPGLGLPALARFLSPEVLQSILTIRGRAGLDSSHGNPSALETREILSA